MGQRCAAVLGCLLCAAVRAQLWNGCRSRVARSALRSATVGWPSPWAALVSAIPKYLFPPARDIVEAAYDVLFSRFAF